MPLCILESVIQDYISESVAIHILTVYILAATLYFVYCPEKMQMDKNFAIAQHFAFVANYLNCSFHNLWFTSRFTFEVNQHVNRTYAVLSIIKE